MTPDATGSAGELSGLSQKNTGLQNPARHLTPARRHRGDRSGTGGMQRSDRPVSLSTPGASERIRPSENAPSRAGPSVLGARPSSSSRPRTGCCSVSCSGTTATWNATERTCRVRLHDGPVGGDVAGAARSQTGVCGVSCLRAPSSPDAMSGVEDHRHPNGIRATAQRRRRRRQPIRRPPPRPTGLRHRQRRRSAARSCL